ncbi:MAG: hypothetical protein D6722_25030 [Bacteroidetes bacterium]|nr:MAG: hypothetical protein D6722_25030 [Bacteroidota bacterium]
MPIYEYTVIDPKTGVALGKREELVSRSIDAKPIIHLKDKDGRKLIARKDEIQLFQRTPDTWGNAGYYGVNGFFNRGIGRYVYSYKEADKIAEARGYAPLSDFPKYYVEDMLEAEDEDNAAYEAELQTYLDNLDYYDGDKALALTETYPANVLLEEDD